MIKIVFKKPGEKAYSLKIENTLEKLQELIGGYIEVIKIDDYIVIFNEEGLLKNLEPNIFIGGMNILGNVIFASSNDDEIYGLENDKIESIIKMLD